MPEKVGDEYGQLIGLLLEVINLLLQQAGKEYKKRTK